MRWWTASRWRKSVRGERAGVKRDRYGVCVQTMEHRKQQQGGGDNAGYAELTGKLGAARGEVCPQRPWEQKPDQSNDDRLYQQW